MGGGFSKITNWLRRGGVRRPPTYSPRPFAIIYTGLLAAGLAGSAGVYFVLVHHVPGMAANRADAVKTALLVVGGSGALGGLYVGYRKQRTDEANHLRDQDKLFTERYTQAVAQLGSTASAAIRLGGVYALARIADDSERDRPVCLSMLCAYLRMPYNPVRDEPAEYQVRRTAQAVLADRLRPEHPGYWVEADVDLRGAYLIDLQMYGVVTYSFNARSVTFAGITRFNKATFTGIAWFGDAVFTGDAWFNDATFKGDAWFDETTFEGDAWFSKAAFNGQSGFYKAEFAGRAGFGEATFQGDTTFGRVTFGADAGFGKATFATNVWYDKATFAADVWFGAAEFGGDAGFGDVRFSQYAEFGTATFAGKADFGAATFTGDVGFGEATFHRDIGFAGTTFGGDTWFDKTTFSADHPPAWPVGFAEPASIRWQPATAVP
ncbi:MAG: pentapeptide repeat-containing protein [Catenulispora sp.]|nr:pentapeptide repeat-containing protein [Catenulispora sp.]